MRPQYVIIGLGNPGAQYEQTRHNIGWMAIDQLHEAFGEGEWQSRQKFASIVTDARINDRPCLLVKPTTFMNRSGEAVNKIVQFFKINPALQILVLSDDIDLESGSYRLRMNGGGGTHNGLKSIVDSIGEAFPRLRIGIGRQPERMDLSAWVLSALSETDVQALEPILKQMPAIVLAAIKEMETLSLKTKFKPAKRKPKSE